MKFTRYEAITYNKRILETYEIFSQLILILQKNFVKGAFVECGYGYGRSFMVLSHFAVKLKRKIYGIDSFIGFPSVSKEDNSYRNPVTGEWAVMSYIEAKKSIKYHGHFENEKSFEIIKLVFDKDASNPIPNEKISFLHIDLDLYEGYKYALEIFWEQIQVGGIILFDEYNQKEWPGATKAVDDFLKTRNLKIKIRKIRNQYYLIKN